MVSAAPKIYPSRGSLGFTGPREQETGPSRLIEGENPFHRRYVRKIGDQVMDAKRLGMLFSCDFCVGRWGVSDLT